MYRPCQLKDWQGFLFRCSAKFNPIMPKAAPKPCGYPGCGVLVRDGTSRCSKHPSVNKFNDAARGSRHERGYGKEWDRARESVLKSAGGLCRACETQGRITLASDVDHVIPKAEGGTDAESNLQALCHDCHSAKSKAEAARGVSRGWGRKNV